MSSQTTFWWCARELILIHVALHFDDVNSQGNFIKKAVLLSFMRFLCCNWWICLIHSRCSIMSIVCNNIWLIIFVLSMSWSILLVCVSLSCSFMLLCSFILRYWLMWGRLGLYKVCFTGWLGVCIWLESWAWVGRSVMARMSKDMIAKESFMYN